MGELKFVLKAVLITAVLIVALQYPVNGVRGEDHVVRYMRTGAVVRWIREATRGAIALGNAGVNEIKKNPAVAKILPAPKPVRKKAAPKKIDPFPDEEMDSDQASL